MVEAIATPATPRIVGRYAIFDEIASGGMATVFLGRLMGAGGFARTIAIKRLHPQFAKDPEFVAMFLDEARLAARIRHPNVVPTLDVVASKGELFLVMEYVRGEVLSRLARALRTRGERVPVPIVLRVMGDALQGLHAAHEARDERGVSLQIVHRDVTPQNILVGADGVGRLLDFGVAKAAGRVHTTREGQIKGKLAYMAPEQLMGTGVGRQTDVYAASVVLWEMLAGERLFAGGSETDVIAKLLKREIKRPSEVADGIPPALDDVVMRGLAPTPEERYATRRATCALALSACGLQEAAGLTVGEWGRGARRGGPRRAVRPDRRDRDPVRTRAPTRSITITRRRCLPSVRRSRRLTASSIPTVTAAQVLPFGALQATADVTRASSMNATTPPSARARVLGAGTAVVVLLGILVFALTRGSHEPAPVTAAPHTVPAESSVSGATAASAAVSPPVAATVAPAAAPSPAASAPSPVAAPSPSPAAQAPAQKAAPSGPRPQRAALPAARSTHKDSVFESRE